MVSIPYRSRIYLGVKFVTVCMWFSGAVSRRRQICKLVYIKVNPHNWNLGECRYPLQQRAATYSNSEGVGGDIGSDSLGISN